LKSGFSADDEGMSTGDHLPSGQGRREAKRPSEGVFPSELTGSLEPKPAAIV